MENKHEGEDKVFILELPEGVDEITADMVKFPQGFRGRVVIPEGVLSIDGLCFYGKPITAVSFPKSLQWIGAWAFGVCRLTGLRVEGKGEKISIEARAFWGNPELTAVTLGNCELLGNIFMGCPVSRVTLTGECIPNKKDITFGFGGCITNSDYFFGTVSRVYGEALGTYTLKGKLAKTNYKDCGKCGIFIDGTRRCYTLAGFEDDRDLRPDFEWEKVE